MMEIRWDKNLVDLNKLIAVSRGDSDRLLRYLNQFQELIPTRIALMQKYLNADDRVMIRQTIHQMSPQLHFFGVPDISESIEIIETEYESIPMEKLKGLSNNLIDKLSSAKLEIDRIVQKYY